MENSISKLQRDLELLDTKWNRVINKDSNPLELALKFLDETSIGLNYRFDEFQELKSQIATDLQVVANDNYQAFNDSVASFSQTLEYITDSQDTLADIKSGVNDSLNKLSIVDETLGELNEEYIIHSKMISSLTALDEILRLHEKIETLIADGNYSHAQEALETVFSLAKEHDLWAIEALKPVKEQFTVHENSLLKILIENITDIIYSKRVSILIDGDSVFSTDNNDDAFGSLENYLHHVIHADIQEETNKKHQLLSEFLKKLGQIYSEDDQLAVNEESDYDKLFSYLKILDDMNKLPSAIELIVRKDCDELHSIVSKSIEDIRLKHPSLLKMSNSIQPSQYYGFAGQDVLAVVLRKLFWEIFVKFFLAVQAHRVVYEVTKALQPPSSSNFLYPFAEVWNNCLKEARKLITDYTKDPALGKGKLYGRKGSSNVLASKNRKTAHIFSLQSNLAKDTLGEIGHTDEIKNMLVDIFPGFNFAAPKNLETIYLDDEKANGQETLVPVSVFNIRVMLESFLVYIQGLKGLLPESLKDEAPSSVEFFKDLMYSQFLPQLEETMLYLYLSQVESSPPFAVETLPGGTIVFKSAVDFKNLFLKLLHITNASNFYRKFVAEILLTIVNRFYTYYFNIYQSLCGPQNTVVSKKLISLWINDKALTKLTSGIFGNDLEFVEAETKALFNDCPKVFTDKNTLDKSDSFSESTVSTLIQFASTLDWISSWLPGLKKVTKYVAGDRDFNVVDLRGLWSFLEVTESETAEKNGSIKFLLNVETANKFDSLCEDLVNLEYTLLKTIRYDIRVRCLFRINHMFHSSVWNPELTSIELDEHISYLISDISFLDNKLRLFFNEEHRTLVFVGIANFINYSLITGSHSIQVLNMNGAKKILRNVNALQQICKTIAHGTQNEELTKTSTFFTLCSTDENAIIDLYTQGKLKEFSKEDVKNALRLLFSEEMHRQLKRNSGTNQRVTSMSASKRLLNAVNKLDQSEKY